MARLLNPHPGEILKEEFLSAIGMSQKSARSYHRCAG